MAHALDGCRAKLDWAEKHLNALSSDIQSFMKVDTQQVVSKLNPIDESYSLYYKEARELPIDWGVRLGDFVHDARSALDHLVYQLVLLSGGTPHNSHQFPIVDIPPDWMRRVQKPPKGRLGLLDFVDSRHVTIIESLQPYIPATGLPDLAVLRDFSNTDKHRLIHVARASLSATPKITAFMSIPTRIRNLEHPKPGTPIEDGTEIARFRSETDIMMTQQAFGVDIANSEMNVQAHFRQTIIFGVPGAESTRIRDFRKILAEVRQIIERFAPEFP